MTQELGPRAQFTVRGKEGVLSFLAPRDQEPLEECELLRAPEATGFEYSADGRLLALVYPTVVAVHDAYTGEQRYEVPCAKVAAVAFSPLGNYLVTWEKPPGAKAEDLNKDIDIPPNMAIWRLAEGVEEVSRFVFKKFVREYWPPTIWSDDEQICARMVNNEVHFYDGDRVVPDAVTHRLRQPGPAPYSIATFVPEKKGQPGRCAMYTFPNFGDGETVHQKSVFKADKADLLWNQIGTAALIFVQSEVDKTGKSYYGEMNLFVMHKDGKFESRVTLDKEGPIHDIAWMPNGKEFIVIYGFMPATATLFDSKATPMFSFGAAPRNTIKPAPHGRFICLGGFGNLQGDMDFWDRNKKKRMTSAKAECANEYAWSPDSRFFLTAVMFPRMRVDNGFTLYSYSGVACTKQLVPEIMEMKWRPAPPGLYADRPASPPKKGAAAEEAAPVAPPKPVGAYRPPGARGGASFKLHDDVEIVPQKTLTKLQETVNLPGPALPVGAEPERLSKSQLKNAKKKAKAQEDKDTAAATAPPAPAPVKAQAMAIAEPVSRLDLERKIRNVKKQLDQIDRLIERQEGGEALEQSQLAKIESRSVVEAELAELEAQL